MENIRLSRRQVLRLGGLAALAWAVPLPVRAAIEKFSADASAKEISLFNTHTGEELEAVFWEAGDYRTEELRRIDHILRDPVDGRDQGDGRAARRSPLPSPSGPGRAERFSCRLRLPVASDQRRPPEEECRRRRPQSPHDGAGGRHPPAGSPAGFLAPRRARFKSGRSGVLSPIRLCPRGCRSRPNVVTGAARRAPGSKGRRAHRHPSDSG